MPKGLIYTALTLIVLAMIPPAMIARQRSVTFSRPRIHIIQDMDAQIKIKAQNASVLFNDGRANRYDPEGTVARGELMEDEHFYAGIAGGNWAATFPPRIVVDMDLLRRGRERFGIYCLPCHGVAGYGDGIVNQRAMLLMESGTNGTTWVQPKSVHEEAIREQPVGQLYNTITNGVRTMSSYGAQIVPEDRWAIVAYIKALQRSQHAELADLTEQERLHLGREIAADELVESLKKRSDAE